MTEQAGSADPARSPRGVLVTPDLLRNGIRFYSSSPGQPRSRRASDTLLLIPAAIALAAMIIAYPAGADSTPLGTFLASSPAFLKPVWNFFFDLLTLWAVILLGSALVRRRRVVLAQTIASLVLAVVLVFVVSRIASGDWPALSAVFGGEFKRRQPARGAGGQTRGGRARDLAAPDPAAAVAHTLAAHARRDRRVLRR